MTGPRSVLRAQNRPRTVLAHADTVDSGTCSGVADLRGWGFAYICAIAGAVTGVNRGLHLSKTA